MSNRYLFRGMRVDTKEWIYGDLIHSLDYTYIQNHNLPDGEYRGPIEVIQETVGQYTGLEDKNDVKIFEGDRTSVCFRDGCIEMAVKHDDIRAGFYLSPVNEDGYWNFTTNVTIEIIGNIHEGAVDE